MTTTLLPELGTRPTTPCRRYRGPHQGAGYATITADGKRMLLHRWIIEQIDGPLEPGEIVMHRCDVRDCFRYDHLRRGSLSENTRDAIIKGRLKSPGSFRGEANGGGGKLNERQVRTIRRMLVEGRGGNTNALAAKYGVSRIFIIKIARGYAWAHVK